MDCVCCGGPVPDGAVRCPGCGAALAGAVDAPTLVCGAGGGDATPTRASQDTRTLGPAGSGAGAAPLAPGDRLSERYEIQSVLGSGGFGAVYRAHDAVLGRTVALKVIRPDLASRPEMVERFKREILLASRITHKNVVRIHDLGESGELKFISMQFVQGTDLKTIIEREGPLALERALPLIRQIAEALVAAHEAGIVHRDLKPQNILVDEAGQAFVADFGISRSVESGQTMTETGAMIGTLAYMSPEQARGETVDHRSDIYSFGLMLYEMLTGGVPFASGTALSQLMRRANEDVPSVVTARAGLPPWIVRIVARAVARDVADRYQSAGDLLQDLERRRATVALRRRVRVRLLQSAGVLLLGAAVVTAGVLWIGGRPDPGPPPLEAELVLVPFRNVSRNPDDEWTRTGLPRLLRFDLEQSQTLRVVTEERLQEIVDGLKLDRAGELDDHALQRVANVLRVENLLTADLYRRGPEAFQLQARLLRVGPAAISGDIPIEVAAQGPEALFDMAGQLAAEVRDRLGISRRGRSRDVAQLSTRSVEALQAYNAGLDLVRSGDDLAAVARLEDAVERDPAFAVAQAELAEAYDRLGQVDRALAAAERAAGDLQNVSAHELARIRAVRARLGGDDEAALAAYGEWIRLAPNQPAAHLALALFQEQRGELAAALDATARALELDGQNPNAKFVHGRLLAKLGHSDEARAEFEEAVRLHELSGNDSGRATVFNGLGNVYAFEGRYQEALEQYTKCLAVQEQLEDMRGIGAALHNVALTQCDLGRCAEAIETQTRSLLVRQELGDQVEVARAYAGLGDIHNRAGNLDEAAAAYEQGLKILRHSGDPAALAEAFGSLGFIKRLQGRYDEAFFFLGEALARREAIGDAHGRMSALSDIGAIEQVQGNFDAALEHYEKGLGIARQSGNRIGLATFNLNLAEIHLDQGSYAAALAALVEAEADARAMEAGDLLASSLRNLADLRRELGDLAGAASALDEAARIAADLGAPALQAQVSIVRTWLHLARGEQERARQAVDEALSAATAAKEHRLLLLARFAAAVAHGSAAELESVIRDAASAELGPIVARARLALAELQGAARPAAALAEVERTVEVASGLGMRDVLLRAHHLAARALRDRGDLETAARRAELGLAELEALRRGLADAELGHWLGRPATARFAKDAAELFAASGRGEPQRRLDSATAPPPPGPAADSP